MIYRIHLLRFLLLVLLFGFPICTSAKVVMPGIFTDHMVFQQKTNAAVWGSSAPLKSVSVTTSWNARTYIAKADTAGNWKVKVSTPAYGGPYQVTVSDGEPVVLSDVMIGEVWVCSGQSNMEMPVGNWGQVNNFKQEVAEADYPGIRLLQIGMLTDDSPSNVMHINGNGWAACSPKTVERFSAVAYFFGRDVFKNTHIPIGLISATWGGTIIEAWMNADALKKVPALKPQAGVTTGPNRPGVLYNAMINPLKNYAIRGVIWYQGEGNAYKAYQYNALFVNMIKGWRESWSIGDFPFYYVQLANWKAADQPLPSSWAELREAQLQTLALPKTGMAVAMDLGEGDNVHFHNKQDVGARLALIARAKTYGQNVVYTGPVLQKQSITGNQVKLSFTHTEGGLKLKTGLPLTGLQVAGADQHFFEATAVIEGSTIIVSSTQVPNPVAVRYAWLNNPDATIYNGAGLPASSFRTDNWPYSTVVNQ